ncbi:uncharacterized protein EHS24_007234 [Apiotrichum porosum]|uniref:Hyaluronate lyase n=1 Tax=Apiotrichum porosum TaxID=105984 RepID=A0A427XXE0_9TREE|nr:uncharacterized protein EHS24_007234 [Apiotrichum porosum]RSH83546.1 hypothetical protein EHS24_007234 [Apiotrichum porosum]
MTLQALFGLLFMLPYIAVAAAQSTTASDMIARRVDFLTGASTMNALGAMSSPPSYYSSLLSKASALSTTSAGYLSSMVTDSSRTTLWSDLPMTGDAASKSGNLGVQFDRLLAIAKCYATPGTAQYNQSSVATQIVSGLNYLSTAYYTSTGSEYGNWWWWEIGIPRDIVDTVSCLGSAMPANLTTRLATAMDHWAPDPLHRGLTSAGVIETGANLVDKALNMALRGIITNNGTEIALGRDALSGGGTPSNSVFLYVTSGDGFYAGGAFVQHTYLPYAGNYGTGALKNLAVIVSLLSGSQWNVTDPNASMIYSVVDNSFAPYLYNGRLMDTVRGRFVSRQRERDYDDGFTFLATVAQLATAAASSGNATLATHLKTLVRGHASRYTGPDWASDTRFGLSQAANLLSVSEDSSVTAADPMSATFWHAGQERLVHRRSAFSFTVSTSSTRIGRFEWGNGENYRGWYQGDGAAYLYVPGQDGQFSDNWWPTVNSYALPGITAKATTYAITTVAGTTAIQRATNSYNGGVTLDGIGGTVGFNLVGYSPSTSTLSALKTWYTFDDVVVAVGTNVVDTSGSAVTTSIENRAFASGQVPTLVVDGASKTASASPIAVTASVHVPGTGGYVLLSSSGAPVTVLTESNSGTWYAINNGSDSAGDTTTVSNDFVRIIANHGTNPTGSSYAYMVIPGADAATTAARASSPGVTFNTASGVGHVVSHAASSSTFAHFFAAGSLTGAGMTGSLTASAACSVGWSTKSTSSYSLAVSDPSHTATSVTVTFPFSASAISGSTYATLVSTSPLKVTVNLSAKNGQRVAFSATP